MPDGGTIEARVRVIYGDTDQMGIVYYANYLRYFEGARTEYLRARGGSYRDWETQGLRLPVVEVSCRYRAPARYDDLLVVRIGLELRRASMKFSYEIVRDGESAVLCDGWTMHACLDASGRPTALPEALRRQVG